MTGKVVLVCLAALLAGCGNVCFEPAGSISAGGTFGDGQRPDVSGVISGRFVPCPPAAVLPPSAPPQVPAEGAP